MNWNIWTFVWLNLPNYFMVFLKVALDFFLMNLTQKRRMSDISSINKLFFYNWKAWLNNYYNLDLWCLEIVFFLSAKKMKKFQEEWHGLHPYWNFCQLPSERFAPFRVFLKPLVTILPRLLGFPHDAAW